METMAVPTADKRTEDLAKTVGHRFDRVEGDVREIRSELRGLRCEVKAGDESLRLEVAALRGEAKGSERGLRAEVKGSERGLRAEIKGSEKGLRTEIKAGGDSLRTEMRALTQNVEDLRTLMIRFFAGTLGSIVAGVVVAVLASHFWD